MPNKHLYRGVLAVALSVFVAGCGVQAKQYVQVRERVDLEPAGNAGYFGGPPPENAELAPMQKTRKMYVIEVSTGAKELPDDQVIDMAPAPQVQADTTRRRREAPPQKVRSAPAARLTPVQTEPSYTEYTVKKGDTLQKISKEFYDGYSKWPRIYEANKDAIKDPNRLKVGSVIRIPTD